MNKKPPSARGKTQAPEYRHPSERLDAARDSIAELNSHMAGLGARRAALDIMMLLRKGRSLDEALQQCRTFTVLEGADRAFARNLVSTALRRRGSLDEVIGPYLDRPLPARASEVMDILRLAAAQLLLLDTPAHAAVATAVELAGQKRETAGYKGLVNAIARKIGKNGKAKLEALPLRVDTPGWLWRSWERSYGPTQARAIAAAHHQPAPLDLTLKPEADPVLFADKESVRNIIPDHIRLPAGAAVRDLPGFAEGNWWVQDIAASLPARALLAAMDDATGKDIIDLCAAPGGKTMQLAAAGAYVTAVDISTGRLERVSENLARTGLKAEIVTANALQWSPKALADAVLIDAPCSATGTLRRNPDVAWTKQPEDIDQLARLQAQFIDRAVTFLKPGGLITYCTCSLERAEGEDQIKAALSRHESLEIVPITPEMVGGLKGVITPDGYLRTLPAHLPDEGGMDGFFAALLRLKA